MPAPADRVSGTTKAEATADDSKAIALLKPRMVATTRRVGRVLWQSCQYTLFT